MELIAIGFLLGVITCFVVAGAGILYADKMASKNDKEGHTGDKDTLYKGKDD